jgi:hypothetical protein
MGQALDEKFAGTWSVMDLQDLTKFADRFAELIVQECLEVINKEHDEGIDRHGDYQLALYEAYREIKEHFGVEE